MYVPKPPIEYADIDLRELERLLDRTKSRVFMNDKKAGFYGALLCSLNFVWDIGVSTAAVDGVNMYWNPRFFMAIPPETRETVLMHELGHISKLHLIRRGHRNPRRWNWACDIYINNELEREGYSFKGIEWCWKDQSYGEMPPEDIYDQMSAQNLFPPCGNPFGDFGKATVDPMGEPLPETNEGAFDDLMDDEDQDEANAVTGDMLEPSEEAKQAQVNSVVQAVHSARTSGQGGSIPGETEQILKQFLAPVIPWELHLRKFFQDLIDNDFSWQVRDRRYPDIYLPGEIEDEGRLEHLIYYLDVSGSVTDAQVIRFNSEVKFIKDYFKPKKLTLVQFDTRITSEKTFLEQDSFDELVVIGRGGTEWAPVRAHIEEHKPTAAVIFTDLGFFDPITKPAFDVPTIWVAINNRHTPMPFGELIHIKA